MYSGWRYVMVRIDREDRAGDRAGDDACQDGRNGCFRSVEAFDRFDHQRGRGEWCGKGCRRSGACTCRDELLAFAAQDMPPFADQVAYVGTHLYGRPFASHRKAAAERQDASGKFG